MSSEVETSLDSKDFSTPRAAVEMTSGVSAKRRYYLSR
jgi:hypothetical protein